MSATVRAAVQTGPRRMEIREFPRPVIGADDGLLRIEACGICGSDVEQYKGNLGRPGMLPMILGHEPLGIVEEIGDRAARRWGVRAGERVALEILIPCRSCEDCLTGRYMSCRNKFGSYGYTPRSGDGSAGDGHNLLGGYVDYAYLHPNAILHPIRNDIPAEIAVMFNPLGAGVRWVCHLGAVQVGDTVVVLGCGQRGLASVIAARAAGAGIVIVTGLAADAHKLALAREFGADYTINVDEENVVERVTEITGGALADLVLELTPMAHQPVRDALACARHGGRVVLAGLKGGRPIELNTDSVINKGLSVIGAYGVDARGYAAAIRIIESGRFPLGRMHTHSFGLTDVARAIETLAGEIPGEQAVHVAVFPEM